MIVHEAVEIVDFGGGGPGELRIRHGVCVYVRLRASACAFVWTSVGAEGSSGPGRPMGGLLGRGLLGRLSKKHAL